METSIRRELKRSLKEHQDAIGRLFQGMSKVASDDAENAWFPIHRSAEEISTVTENNRIISLPYTKFMNAIMDVNQTAAVLLMSSAEAARLGIPKSKWVYLHGAADLHEAPIQLSQRKDLHRNYAVKMAGEISLSMDCGP